MADIFTPGIPLNYGRSFLNNTNDTQPVTHNADEVYIENFFAYKPIVTFLQTTAFMFISELCNKTVLLVMLLKIKSDSTIKVFFCTFLAMIFTTSISIMIGNSMDLFLYQNFVDVLSIFIFLFYGIYFCVSFFKSDGTTLEDEIDNCLIDEEEETDSNKVSRVKSALEVYKKDLSQANKENIEDNLQDSKISFHPDKSFDLEEPLLLDTRDKDKKIPTEIINDYNYHRLTDTSDTPVKKQHGRRFSTYNTYYNLTPNTPYFGFAIMKSVFISEFCDRTQICMLGVSSVYNFVGVSLGATFGLICACIFGCTFGEKISHKIKCSYLEIINAVILFLLALEIIYANDYINIFGL